MSKTSYIAITAPHIIYRGICKIQKEIPPNPNNQVYNTTLIGNRIIDAYGKIVIININHNATFHI